MQKEEQENEYLESLTCPSFNCYSTDELAGISQSRIQKDDASFLASQNDDPDFEFAAFRDEAFFSNDDAVFPLFNSDVARHSRNSVSGGLDSGSALLRFPITGEELRRSENDPSPAPSSESSSSADESEVVPAGTYCVWRSNSPGKCKKSNSTGSSTSLKKWKLLDLLRRSKSEGKESLMILSPAPEKKKVNERWSIEVAGKSKGKGFAGEKKVAVSPHEALYLRNRELRMVDKKKSFLPYKPGLVGFCTNRLGKAFPSF